MLSTSLRAPAPRRCAASSRRSVLTLVIVKFKKTASAADKNKILDDIKKAGGTIKNDEHVESSSECARGLVEGVEGRVANEA